MTINSPPSGCASTRPSSRHIGPLWLFTQLCTKVGIKAADASRVQPSFPLSSSPPLCTGLFHPGQRRVPTSSSCLHNNPQLFFFSPPSYLCTPRIDATVPSVRLRRAPDPRWVGFAPLWMTRQLNGLTVHTRAAIFLSTIRASGACAHGRAQPSRGVLPPRLAEKTGERTRLRDGDPAQTVRTKPGRPSLLSNSSAPPQRQSVFVLHLTGGARTDA